MGTGADLVLDMVGSDDSIALGAKVARFQSHVTVVGLAGGKFEFAFGALPFEAQLTIPYWGSAVELAEVLDLARKARSALTSSASGWTTPRRPTRECGREPSTAAR